LGLVCSANTLQRCTHLGRAGEAFGGILGQRLVNNLLGGGGDARPQPAHGNRLILHMVQRNVNE
jgi:hypothetical protein